MSSRGRYVRWIDQPAGYVMVGMSAELAEREPDRITGQIDDPSCQEFTNDRVSDQWQPPPA